ncbi:MAG: hypothetical protein MRZ79_02010 [Bacteroidia bacterium]|nr:hypothetical protein [Bacteroidia bacterium]
MPPIVYTLGIHLYGLAIRLASPFSQKARKWVAGRKGWEENWRKIGHDGRPICWIHCASLGEFEMARPLIRQIKAEFPQNFLLVSFFSPSGYEQIKNDPLADSVQYLPLDTPSNMKKLMSSLKVELLILVKNELWLNWLSLLKNQEVPIVMIGSNLSAEKSAMKGMIKKANINALQSFQQIFTQSEGTTQFLSQYLPEENLSTSKDTRFDRVRESRNSSTNLPEIAQLTKGKKVWIGGSTYLKDEEFIFEAFEQLRHPEKLSLILAPHEIDQVRIDNWIKKYPKDSIKYSEWDKITPYQILWVDHIGMLSKLYKYADLAFIGGGWNHGLHNILEAATFGCPIFFGSKYKHFPEALDLVELGTAFPYHKSEELISQILKLSNEPQLMEKISRTNITYIDGKGGASQQIFDYLKEARLLA